MNSKQTYRVATGTQIRPQQEVTDTSLTTYFRDMSRTPLLTPERETELAQEIRTRDENVWAELLSYPGSVDHFVKAIEVGLQAERLEVPTADLKSLRAAATRAKKTRRKPAQQSLERAASKAARVLCRLDLDHTVLDAVLAELAHVRVTRKGRSVPEPLGFSAAAQGFMNFCDRVRARQSAALEARNRFVRSNLGLVVSVARRYRHTTLSLQDLIQEGNLGLLKAVARFDPERGFRFSTYATWWIRHAIGRSLADKGRTVRIPVHVLEARQKIKKTERSLALKLGREPSNDELANAVGMDVPRLQETLEHAGGYAVSLDEQLSDDGERERIEVFQRANADGEPPSAYERIARGSILRRVTSLLRELAPMERDVIKRRFGLEGRSATTLQEIADSYGLSRERIRQIQEKALAQVRNTLDQEEAI